ncbi:hypothetical protein L7F22_047838 [Adiantum nelumboides]|nr:hypothetical protein [Adiantum nelumboides]
MCQRIEQLTIELEDPRKSLAAAAKLIKKKKQAEAMKVDTPQFKDDEVLIIQLDYKNRKQWEPLTSVILDGGAGVNIIGEHMKEKMGIANIKPAPFRVRMADQRIVQPRRSQMTSAGNSMLYSFLLFIITLSLQQMYKEKLASSEVFTILGGFISSLLFLLALTFIGNWQETLNNRTGWGAVFLSGIIATIAASAVHRVCVTTCFIVSIGILYEVNKLSAKVHQKAEVKKKAF